MPLQRTTQPASEPLTLQETKLHLRVDHDDEDDYLYGLIAAARQACENRVRRTLITSAWTLTLDRFPCVVKLPMPPSVSVSSIGYVDALGVAQTLDPGAYRLDVASEPARIEPVDAWPHTDCRINAVTIVYGAGYGDAAAVPQPLRTWMLMAIGDMYANRERSRDKSAVPQDYADGLLDPYKIWG